MRRYQHLRQLCRLAQTWRQSGINTKSNSEKNLLDKFFHSPLFTAVCSYPDCFSTIFLMSFHGYSSSLLQIPSMKHDFGTKLCERIGCGKTNPLGTTIINSKFNDT